MPLCKSSLFASTKHYLDCRRHQMGLCGCDPGTISTVVRWRILPCSTKDQERIAPFDVSQGKDELLHGKDPTS